MSRIGRKPIPVPSTVQVEVRPGAVSVTGPRGTLSERIDPDMVVVQEDGQLVVNRPSDRGRHRALHGLTRSLVANMVLGVVEGYERRLEIHGVGYRAALRGTDLEMQLGFSHPVVVRPPEGIAFEVPAPNQVVVRGISKQAVGEVAAQVRKWRPPEPYKGKGIRYVGEQIVRKVGKRA